MEGLYLLGFGPRAARAARDLALALYPSIEPAVARRAHAVGARAAGLSAVTQAVCIGRAAPIGVAQVDARAGATGAVVVLLLAAAVAVTIGAAGIPLGRIAAAFGLAPGNPALVDRDWLVLWSIRLPRIALAMIIGGLLAACGAVMQGLFRNPLADPALVGVSSGAGACSSGDDRRGRPLSGRGRRHAADRSTAARRLRRGAAHRR